MAKTPEVAVTPLVLTWARDIAGFTVEEVARRLHVPSEKVTAWENGEEKPSLARVRTLAQMYRRPPAFFFLAQPPAPDLPSPPDFRGEGLEGSVSRPLRKELRRAVERRRAFLDIHGPLPSRLTDGAVSRRALDASIARDKLGVSVDAQLTIQDSRDAFRMWLRAAEDAGVLIFQMSRIPTAECRGFSLYETEVPVIVINGADPVEARSFTLLHEIGHLLQHSGGLCLLRQRGQIERACNAFAAEMLMPEQYFLAALGNDDPIEAIPRLALRFRVSREATAVRLRVLGRITQEQLDAIREEAANRLVEARERQRERESGPPHYRTHLRNLGTLYVSSVLEAYYAKEISLVEAAYHLEAKVSTIRRMEEALQQEGPVAQ